MKVAYKYRIYPTDSQKKMLDEQMLTYHLVSNIGKDILRTYIVREQRKNQTFTEKKNKDGEKVKFPKYKYPSKIGIQNMIYHLKDENDCEYW